MFDAAADETTELARQLLLDHGRHPRHFHDNPDATHIGSAHNPLCGDEVTLYLAIAADRIAHASFLGHGCALSTASASLLADRLVNTPLSDALRLTERFTHFMADRAAPVIDSLEKFTAFAGARQFPSRVKCALLPFVALQRALPNKPAMPPKAL